MTTIQFSEGSMIVNDTEISTENRVRDKIVGGRSFIPFRTIGTTLNVNVDWNLVTRTATYNN